MTMTLDNLDSNSRMPQQHMDEVINIASHIRDDLHTSTNQAINYSYDRFKQEAPNLFEHKQKVVAERFDGSNQMIEKYKLKSRKWATINMLNTNFGRMPVQKGDWITTDENRNHDVYSNADFRNEFESVGWK